MRENVLTLFWDEAGDFAASRKVKISNFLEFLEFTERLKVVKEKHGIPFLFRGLGNEKFDLKPTLQRNEFSKNKITCDQYYHSVLAALKEVFEEETSEWFEYLVSIKHLFWPKKFPNDPQKSFGMGYESACSRSLYTYLRHIGSPSPLIDWSRDPLIATSFAVNEKDKGDFFRIHVFPQLKRLAWQLNDTVELNPRDALDLYERNWRYIDLDKMSIEERELILRLMDFLGRSPLLT